MMTKSRGYRVDFVYCNSMACIQKQKQKQKNQKNKKQKRQKQRLFLGHAFIISNGLLLSSLHAMQQSLRLCSTTFWKAGLKFSQEERRMVSKLDLNLLQNSDNTSLINNEILYSYFFFFFLKFLQILQRGKWSFSK